MLHANINIGFRHFFPAYIWILLLATRCVASRSLLPSLLAWGTWRGRSFTAPASGPTISATSTSRDQVYWLIDDIDWGQGLKQTRQWIDKNARDGRLIAVWYFGPRKVGLMRDYLGDKVTLLEASTHGTCHTPGMQTEKPTHGWLIISAVYEPGAHRHDLSYQVLRKYPPTATIGHCILVYALNKISNGKGFDWGEPPAEDGP